MARLAIEDNLYDVSESALDRILGVAKSYVRNGIYATRIDDFVELKNEEYDSIDKLQDAVMEYAAKGIEVLYCWET